MMSSDSSSASTVTFDDRGHSTAAFAPLTPEEYSSHYSSTGLPLVIDAGSYEFRAGFCNELFPRLRIRPFVGKSKGTKLQADFYCKVGNQLDEIERIKLRSRTPFDGAILSYYETMEHLLDYCFLALGLDGQEKVDHPIIFTEPPCNPNFARGRLSEMVFEAYGAPAVSYGIDALFAYHYNRNQHASENDDYGLIVNSGHNFTHVIPIVEGLPVLTQSARISVGGSSGHVLLESDLANDYPQHRTSITPSRAQEIVEKYCQMSENDYDEELKKIALFDINKQNINNKPCIDPIIIQLPFIEPTVPVISEDELRQRENRRKENADRLRQLLAKKRDEQIVQLQSSIFDYEELKNKKLLNIFTPEEFNKLLKKGGFDNETDFENTLSTFKRRLHKLLTGEEEIIEEKKSDEEIYPLLNIPDEELTTDQLKEKRKQKMFKGAAEARNKKREEKLIQEQKKLEREKQEILERESNPQQYINKLKALKLMISEKRAQRIKIESMEISGGRRSVTSRKRMALLASQMGNKDRLPTSNEKDDRFGANDDDWDVYKHAAIPSKQFNNDSENDSEEERTELANIEEKLLNFDPNYQKPENKKIITEKDFQLEIYVNRIRIPELIYKPSMIGIDESGLTETIRRILIRMDEKNAEKLMKNILITGGNSNFQFFDQRLKKELISIRPVNSIINIYKAKNSMIDAWRGAAKLGFNHFIENKNNSSISSSSVPMINYITKQMYDECGADYLSEHSCSNKYFPTPELDDEDIKAAKKRKR